MSQRLFESDFCTALISELVRKRISDDRTGDRKWPTAKCAAVVSWYTHMYQMKTRNRTRVPRAFLQSSESGTLALLQLPYMYLWYKYFNRLLRV